MRIRFSIKGLMIATAFVSVGFAGSIYPNPILAASVYTGAFVIILCGIRRQSWAIAKSDSHCFVTCDVYFAHGRNRLRNSK